MDNRIYKEACRIESKCVHNRDDLSLSLSLLAVLQFPKNKSSVAKSKNTDVVPHSVWSFEKKNLSGNPLVELHITLDSIRLLLHFIP